MEHRAHVRTTPELRTKEADPVQTDPTFFRVLTPHFLPMGVRVTGVPVGERGAPEQLPERPSPAESQGVDQQILYPDRQCLSRSNIVVVSGRRVR